MYISLVTPAGKHTRVGNWTTVARWARILRGLGHRVRITETDERCDAAIMVAVHAWRSAPSIERFAQAHPDRPLVVCLAGTDIYRFQHSDPLETLKSMELASALVCLHDLVHLATAERFTLRPRNGSTTSFASFTSRRGRWPPRADRRCEHSMCASSDACAMRKILYGPPMPPG